MTTSMRPRTNPALRTSWRSRLWWKRLQRRAVAAYEADLLTGIRQLGRLAVPVIGVSADPASPAGVVRLQLPGGSLTLAGVSPAASVALRNFTPGVPRQLADGGRYGRRWWVTIAEGERTHLVAGSHLRLARTPAVNACPADDLRFFSQRS